MRWFLQLRVRYRLAAIGGVAALLAQMAWFWHSTIEDAFISFRYAQNWAMGRGLVWNVGEAVEGYSNFLWTLALGMGVRLGLDPVVFAKWLGVIAALALIATLVWGARRLAGNEAAALAAALAGCSTALAFWATAGLETLWYSLWVTMALGWFVSRTPGGEMSGARAERGRFFLYALFLALAALTRPEGLGLAVVLLLFDAWRNGPRSALRAAALFAAIYAPFLLWRWLTYGALTPNTLAAKAGIFEALAIEPVRFLTLSLGYVSNWVVKWGVVLWLPLAWGARRHAAALPLLLTLAYTAIVALAGAGDWMPLQRFWLSAMAPFVWLAVIGWQYWRPTRPVLAAGLVIALILLQFDMPALRFVSRDTRSADVWWQTHMRNIANVVADAPLPIATTVLGRTGYYLPDHPVLDAFGLTDAHIAREGAPLLRLGRTDWDYVLAHDPAFILINDPQPGLRQRMAETGSYRWLDLPSPPDFEVALFVRSDLATSAAQIFAAQARPPDDPALDARLADYFLGRQRLILGPLYRFCDPLTVLCQPFWHTLKP